MKSTLRSGILLVGMVMAASLAWALTPRQKLADENIPIALDKMVPTKFGDWTEVPTAGAAVLDPGRQQLLGRIYSETLSRVYVNSEKYTVMLSIAYGRDQSDGFQLHQPEVCYPAQGFTVLDRTPHQLEVPGQSVPAMRVNTRGPRPEPLTYWTVVGERAYLGGVAKKLTEMRYGLAGKIPDGMLIRISSVDPQAGQAYAVQDKFAAAFAGALAPEVRSRFMGAPLP